jgi:TolB-like protein
VIAPNSSFTYKGRAVDVKQVARELGVRYVLEGSVRIGSIRRECLDHVVVLGERNLRHLLANYATYYNGVRTHLALDKDAPLHRSA